MNRRKLCAILLGVTLFLSANFSQASSKYEMVIKNGRIVDGSGNPWFYADVGITDGKIAKIGRIDTSEAAQVIDAKNLIVAPAFIDVHTHVENGIMRMPTADNFLMQQPFCMVASDAGVIEMGRGVPHPRGYGNNVRVLGKYVREKKLLGLEDAIRKMTSLPAQTFGLWDRGLIREGFAADLVIFDAEKVIDRATFQQPHQYAAGIQYVLVNGRMVVSEGKHTGARPGKILYGAGKS